MSNLMFVINNNIEVINPFKFKCTHCGTEFDITDVERNCPNCDIELFERMKKSTFKELMIDSLAAFGIDKDKITTFTNWQGVKLSELDICNELSTIIDRNFEIRFGGQYKSFLVNETYEYIKSYNFSKD